MKFYLESSLYRSVLISLVFTASTFAESQTILPQNDVVDLSDLLGSGDSEIVAVNDQGVVLGQYDVEETVGLNAPFIFGPGFSVEKIEQVDGNDTEVIDINNNRELLAEWHVFSEGGEGKKTPVIYREGWIEATPLTSVSKINNNGDVLGLVDVQRGKLSSSVAVLKSDGTVVDIMEGMSDCDEEIAGDCDGEYRLDFDHFRFVRPIDINDNGQVLFNFVQPGSGSSNHWPMVYTPGQGIKTIVLQNGKRRKGPRDINNNGVVLLSTSSRGHSSTHLYSSNDGTDLTPGSIFDPKINGTDGFTWFAHKINDSNIVAGEKIAFSLTDVSQTVTIDPSFETIDMSNNYIIARDQAGKLVRYTLESLPGQ